MNITTEELRTVAEHRKNPLIVAFGGGINSTAMLIGMQQRQVKPDLILFADTGGELPETYEHTQRFSRWLCERGFPDIIWVSKTFAGNATTLEADCLRNHTLPSIAFGFKGCSIKYKREPQDKYCNHWEPARQAWGRGLQCVKAIGYDAGEARRATIAEDTKYRFWYPLLEWDWWREECVSVCDAEGFHPPKSACFFCPNAGKQEILQLMKKHPRLLERALRMEANATLTSIKGLGRHRFAWRDVIDGEKSSTQNSAPADNTPCGCYDGE
jgi:hypothetical protein